MEEQYMRQAAALAQKGMGKTNPNPLVGAVIVKDGRVIGQGYHQSYGGLHAERNALASCAEDPQGASVYVTLEPCCHYGKTPPCTDALIRAGVKEVIIGSHDPNPLVAGKGAQKLRQAGIEVTEGFLKQECDRLNPVFFHYISTGMPYVALKYAMTLDGKIATKTGASKWITGEKARAHVQQLRNYYSGIMVGIGTVLQDDPQLTCRIPEGRNPVRIVCDSALRIPLDRTLCKTAAEIPTIVACGADASEGKQAELERLGITVLRTEGEDGKVGLQSLMKQLGERKLDSILLEGGSGLAGGALDAGIVQKVYAYIAPKIFGGKAPGPVSGQGAALPGQGAALKLDRVQWFGEDLLLEYEVE